MSSKHWSTPLMWWHASYCDTSWQLHACKFGSACSQSGWLAQREAAAGGSLDIVSHLLVTNSHQFVLKESFFPLTPCKYLQVNVAACCSGLNEWVNEWNMRIINTAKYGQKLQLLGCTRPYYPKTHASFRNGNPNLWQSIIYPGDQIILILTGQRKIGKPDVTGQWRQYNSATMGFLIPDKALS